jgi:hypothetical protein
MGPGDIWSRRCEHPETQKTEPLLHMEIRLSLSLWSAILTCMRNLRKTKAKREKKCLQMFFSQFRCSLHLSWGNRVVVVLTVTCTPLSREVGCPPTALYQGAMNWRRGNYEREQLWLRVPSSLLHNFQDWQSQENDLLWNHGWLRRVLTKDGKRMTSSFSFF